MEVRLGGLDLEEEKEGRSATGLSGENLELVYLLPWLEGPVASQEMPVSLGVGFSGRVFHST